MGNELQPYSALQLIQLGIDSALDVIHETNSPHEPNAKCCGEVCGSCAWCLVEQARQGKRVVRFCSCGEGVIME